MKSIILREGGKEVQDDARNICYKGNAYKALLEKQNLFPAMADRANIQKVY
jgi:hypothetical protein